MYLWAIIPLVIIDLGLIIYCLSDWLKRKQFRWMNKWIWLVLFVCIHPFGAILYIIIIKNLDDNKL
jgi:Phospholipase_D-nuclease N-terminal